TGDQHRRGCGRDFFDDGVDVAHAGRLTDDLKASFDVADVLEVVTQDHADGGRLADGDAQLVLVERLRDIVVGAILEGGDGRIDRTVGRDDDDRQTGFGGLDRAQQLEAVH